MFIGGKYKNELLYLANWFAREVLRFRLKKLVTWNNKFDYVDGCTVVLGMCSKLPDVLMANLTCLNRAKWPEMSSVIISVDASEIKNQKQIENSVKQELKNLDVKFVYYTKEQSTLANKLQLPFVFSWLSWCNAIKLVKTRDILIHDYDALILSGALSRRYYSFLASSAKVQGISWYASNGLIADDRLATTFEMFVKTDWIKSFNPINLFNKNTIIGGRRSVDFDTTLLAQYLSLNEQERQIVPMSQEDLMHPSQMIHQYTMFRKFPGKPLPCFSIILIPFFSYLGGKQAAISEAVTALKQQSSSQVYLLGDDTLINLTSLDKPQIDWALKQIIQACIKLNVSPFNELYEYGYLLYKSICLKNKEIWTGDFNSQQIEWIKKSTII